MREILPDLARWQAEGRRCALARVVEVVGSAPRGPGAAMAVAAGGEVAGSLAGGCVEPAVVAAAEAVLSGGGPRIWSFGCTGEDPFATGLTCGGTLVVLVEPLEEPGWPAAVAKALTARLEAGEEVVLATVLEGPSAVRTGSTAVLAGGALVAGSLGDPALLALAQGWTPAGNQAAVLRTALAGGPGAAGASVFLQAFARAPRMVICGAVDFSAALAKVAKILGYRGTVCDPRPAFATARRFPEADEVVVDQPARHLGALAVPLSPLDAVCVLTHDEKFDVPALQAALGSQAGYVGAMGSRRTTAARQEALARAGVDPGALVRVMAPIGLDIGARTPEETAVAICAEIVARRAGRGGSLSLREGTGPLHGPAVR